MDVSNDANIYLDGLCVYVNTLLYIWFTYTYVEVVQNVRYRCDEWTFLVGYVFFGDSSKNVVCHRSRKRWNVVEMKLLNLKGFGPSDFSLYTPIYTRIYNVYMCDIYAGLYCTHTHTCEHILFIYDVLYIRMCVCPLYMYIIFVIKIIICGDEQKS